MGSSAAPRNLMGFFYVPMKRDSMIIYRSFYEAIKELPKENQAEVWSAVYELGLNGKTIQLEGISKTIFTLIAPQLEANYKKLSNRVGLQTFVFCYVCVSRFLRLVW